MSATRVFGRGLAVDTGSSRRLMQQYACSGFAAMVSVKERFSFR
jgi:hypothetical protein